MPIADGPRVAAGYMSQSALYGAAIQDALENVRDLQWPASVETYAKMRRDPQIASTLNAYTRPLSAATWAVDGDGCRAEVVEFVADAWGLPILGRDKKIQKGFRRRGVIWDDHLRLALLSLVYGHMPFAIAGEVRDGRWRLTTLAERLPQTITEIDTTDAGDLKGITQYGSETQIRASNLLWYVHEREGSNWVGTSMLREAYGPWLLKHEMWRVLATSSRRFGMGVPWMKAPPGATNAEIEQAARAAEAMRVGDQSGLGVPDGFVPGLMGLTGSVPDTLGFVKYLDEQISQAVLASVLDLDQTANGSRALGDVLVGLLRKGWEAAAKEIAIPASQFTGRMIDWNWGEGEPGPAIVCTDLTNEDATYEAIAALLASGALTADPGLESALRKRFRMPEIDPEFEKKPASAFGLPAPGETDPDAPADDEDEAVPAKTEDADQPAKQATPRGRTEGVITHA